MLYIIWLMAFYIHFTNEWLCTCKLYYLLSFMAQETEQAKLMKQLPTMSSCASVSVEHMSIYINTHTMQGVDSFPGLCNFDFK